MNISATNYAYTKVEFYTIMLRWLIIGIAATLLLRFPHYSEARTFEDVNESVGIQIGKKESVEKKVFDSYVHITDIEDYPEVCSDYDNENCAKTFLEELDVVMKRNNNRIANADYRYSTNVNKENLKLKSVLKTRMIAFGQKLQKKLRKFKWHSFRSPWTRRIFQMLTPTIASDNITISQRLVNISKRMEYIYNNGQPCSDVCLPKGETGIIKYFRMEKDYDKLLAMWSAWRNVTGRRIRKLYIESVKLENEGAKENGHLDAASFELNKEFEEDNFNETVIRLYEQILPLYKELHGFVRHCLSKFYPGRFDENGPIPAHIVGDVWAQRWGNLFPMLQKCRGGISVFNIQDEVNERLKLLTVKEMFLKAEDFYTSIGLYQMTRPFWERSVLTKQAGKLINCHGSAFDLSNGEDFRILMCTQKNFNDIYTIHHEMGHIEYYMAYRNLHYIYQESANVGFHEAIGDAIVLSSNNPKHLKNAGLLLTFTESKEFEIDYLLQSALDRIAFIPFALTMDSFKWGVYNGSVPFNKMNEYWWKLHYRHQGLKPPIERSENDFDPGSKYHIAFRVSYIRYFASFFYQFQFYEAMCGFSGHSGPLHQCDFYGSKAAGKRLLKMMAKGRSQHWRDTLHILTGSRDISSDALMKYYEPLHRWLQETNKRLNITIGW